MIPKADILERAQARGLQPTTVDKDYVLGWLLYGIAHHKSLSSWVFKGGTCLKKCFFETYRFSEDLDFTVPDGSDFSEKAVAAHLSEVADWIEDRTGLKFPRSGIQIDKDRTRPEKRALQARMTYQGPHRLSAPSRQRVKFDLTMDEILIDEPTKRPIHHGYRDALDSEPKVLCYSIDEIVAEKTRAIFQRQGRARDLYDLVHLSRSFREAIDPEKTVRIAREKFAFKGIPEPTVDNILARVDHDVMKANWQQQLVHQLPVLPPFDGFLGELSEAIAWWMEPTRASPTPGPISSQPTERTEIRSHFPQGSGLWPGCGIDSPSLRAMDSIRYGARNRLLVEVHHKGRDCLVEPYSLRSPGAGTALLYVWEVSKDGEPTDAIRSYGLDEVDAATVTDRAFTPRFAVEL